MQFNAVYVNKSKTSPDLKLEIPRIPLNWNMYSYCVAIYLLKFSMEVVSCLKGAPLVTYKQQPL